MQQTKIPPRIPDLRNSFFSDLSILTGFRPLPAPNWPRQLVELSILFVMAVLTLRGFIMEGYMITTGSMAPGLLGLHKQIQCPDCGNTFAFGVSFDQSVKGHPKDSNPARQYATCPNCGQQHINTAQVPLNHGDQLLVHKGVFQFRHPKRWEAIVFRNPDDPGEAYVKRATGLPGETIRVAGGDLFVNGVIATKSFRTQCDTRIQVFDLHRQSTAEDWSLPWKLGSGWEQRGSELVFPAASETGVSEARASSDIVGNLDGGTVRLNFHRRSGGQHVSEVAFASDEISLKELEAEWNRCLQQLQQHPIWWLTKLELDRDRMVLRQRGVMPFEMQQALVSASSTDTFRRAVFRLAALSHQAPITDRYGYNSVVSSPEFPIQDLMLEVVFRSESMPEEIKFQIPVGEKTFLLSIHPVKMQATLSEQETGQVLRTTELSTDQALKLLSTEGFKLQVSNFDHRLLVVADGKELFSSIDIPVDLQAVIASDAARQKGQEMIPTAHGPVDHKMGQRQAESTTIAARQQRRWQFKVVGGKLRVTELRLFRDVYYTPGRRRNAVQSDCVVPQGHYFVMGDNSPVSSDSRNWSQPFVPDHLLIGKPFIVHLPSRPGAVNSGGSRLSLRLPDFRRIRLIP
ncbi:MAG: S26 family signal peptidase [Fuerstiella sp.]